MGHNDDNIIEEMRKYLSEDNILLGLDMFTPAKYNFVSELISILPKSLEKNIKLHFCGPTGTDATEAALKLFRIATGNKNIITFHGAFHGMSLGAMEISGNLSLKNKINSEISGAHSFPYPYEFRNPYNNKDMINISLAHIRNSLTESHSGISKPAAIFVEAIQGEGGCIPAPKKWLKGLRKIATELNIPLVLDEIQSGFGRTGKIFAFEHADIIPDAILLSKAIGGGLPMSVLVYNKKYDKWDSGAHTGTFRGNQLAMISGAKTISIIKNSAFLDDVNQKSNHMFDTLNKFKNDYDFIGDVRGYGLMIGIEIIYSDKKNSLGHKLSNPILALLIKKICFENGLIIETGGRDDSVIRFLPALNINIELINKALDIFKNALNHCNYA